MPTLSPVHIGALIVLAIVNYPLYRLIGRRFFEDWSEFSQAILFWFTPDSWSFLRGEFMEDLWAELKLTAFVLCCAAIVGLEFLLLSPLLAKFS